VQFEPTRLPEVVLIKPRVIGDARGFFFESWHAEKFAAAEMPADACPGYAQSRLDDRRTERIRGATENAAEGGSVGATAYRLNLTR
jgi:dTDP-4-dehydrorhamnose 3,5-epimerase-like enzyme